MTGTTDISNQTEAAPPLAEGRFRLIRALGEGGMATVYAAHDNRLGVSRAIKVLSPELSSHSRIRARFIAEARTMAALEHGNIVRVYDVELSGERPYIVMELVEGGSLVDWMAENGPMPPRMAVEILIEILKALQAAHSHGVIHRDIKPHNVLLTADGVTKVTDFGIARTLQTDGYASLTRTGAVMGTWAFMAPEQRSDAKNVDQRADIYATGATLFALVTDRTPADLFAADLDAEMLAIVPEILHDFLRRATRYKREERFTDAAEMCAAAEALLDRLPALPENTSPLTGTRSPKIIPSISKPPKPLTARSSETLMPSLTTPDQTFAVDHLGEDFSSPDPVTGEEPVLPVEPTQRRLWPAVLGGLLVAGLVLGGGSQFFTEEPDPEPIVQEDPVIPAILNLDEGPVAAAESVDVEAVPAAEIEAGEAVAARSDSIEEPAVVAAVVTPTASTAARSAEVALTEPVIVPAAAPARELAEPATQATASPLRLRHRPPTGSSRTFKAWVEGGSYDRINLAWRTSSTEGWREQTMIRRGDHFIATLPQTDSVQYFITARSSNSDESALKIGSAFSPLSL